MARPSKYDEWLTESGLLTMKGWARDGFSNKQIAGMVGIRADTFSTWVTRFPKLSNALKEGRIPVKIKVEDAMYSRCEWRLVEEETTEEFVNSKGEKSIKRRKTKRWIPPDTAMMIFVSKNLMPEKFTNKPEAVEIEDTSDVDGDIYGS